MFSTFISAIFIENMIFAYFLGICSFLAISKNVKVAFGLGIAINFVMIITVPLNYLLETYILKAGAMSWLGESFASVDLSFLSFIIFIAVIASITQILEMIMERYTPALNVTLGIFLPLIAVNCAIMGGVLFMQQKAFPNVGYATVYGIGSGLGWLIAIVGLAAIREKLQYSDIPKPLKGVGIAFIITALMGLGFMSFSGIQI